MSESTSTDWIFGPWPSQRAHHDVPGQLHLVGRRPALDRGADVFRILAPVAERAQLAADRDRRHLAARLLERAQHAEFGGRLHDDAVEIAGMVGEPLLHFGLRDLIRPHARRRRRRS